MAVWQRTLQPTRPPEPFIPIYYPLCPSFARTRAGRILLRQGSGAPAPAAAAPAGRFTCQTGISQFIETMKLLTSLNRLACGLTLFAAAAIHAQPLIISTVAGYAGKGSADGSRQQRALLQSRRVSWSMAQAMFMWPIRATTSSGSSIPPAFPPPWRAWPESQAVPMAPAPPPPSTSLRALRWTAPPTCT